MMTPDLSKPAMEVPPEVLGRILAYLEKEDLNRVRLVSKKLEQSAVLLLFDEVYLSTNPAEIEIAQNTIRNFGKSIKTVYFSAVEYSEMGWGRFKNAVGPSRTMDYVRLAHTNYCRLREEQQEMFRAGTYFGHLCYALRTIPNAQRLVITGFEAYAKSCEWTRRRSRLWRVGDCPAHCSIQGCTYGNLKHLNYMSGPLSVLYYASRNIHPWSLVMMGLAATDSQVRELKIASSYEGYVPRGGFNKTLQQSFELQEIFQGFCKLQLGFHIHKNSMDKHIAQTLSAATNLKSLCVVAYWAGYHGNRYRRGGPTAFQEIFGGCEFLKLRSLILNGFTSTEAELVSFLRGSSHLQQLTLTYHKLGWEDKWESCMNAIKLALPTLEHIVVDALTFNYNDHSLLYHIQHCSRTDIQGFFFQGKTNPFTCEQIRDKRIRTTFVTTDDANRPLRVQARNASWMTTSVEFH